MMHAVAKTKDSEGPARANALEERIRTNLCAFIEGSGYSATQVADMAGVPQANLGRYMRGDSSIPGDVLRPLADVLGRRSVDDFYEARPAPQRTAQELADAQPLFGKTRPGFELSAEDLSDFEELLNKICVRREKKKTKR